MPLTTQQLMIINNIMYSENPSIYDAVDSGNPQIKGASCTLGDLVKRIDAKANAGDYFTSDEWKMIKKAVREDKTLAAVTIEQTYRDKSTGDAGCVLKNGDEAVIVFRGTGIDEWRDDARAGSTMKVHGADETISPQQQKAIDFVNGLDLSGYKTVTVTGHSKGGNKAKIVTLLTDKIDRCVSFDGQGFSDEFMKAHKDDIIANQGKIENHNVDKDFVNILLNDVGRTEYYKSHRTEKNFGKNHSPTAFMDENGKMVPGQQSEITKRMDQVLNRMLRSLPPNKKADVLELVGAILDSVLGTGRDDKLGNLADTLTHPKYREALKLLAQYGLLEILCEIPGIGTIIKGLRALGLLPPMQSGDDISHGGDDIRYDDKPKGGHIEVPKDAGRHARQGVDAVSGKSDRLLVSTEAMQHALTRYKEARQRLAAATKSMDSAWSKLERVWDGGSKAAFGAQWIVLMGNIRKSEKAVERSIRGLTGSVELFTTTESENQSAANNLSPGEVPPLF